MIYVDKNGKIYNDVITDNNVIITSGEQIGKNLKDVIDEQQNDINKLKSNVKHIYVNGGVGGNGSGGTGSGGTAEPILNILLNDNSVVNNGSPILLNEPGEYELYFKVRNSGGKNYRVTYAVGNDDIKKGKTVNLSSDNKSEATVKVNLSINGVLKVRFYNEDWDILGETVQQPYIVSPHNFGVQFLYESVDGEIRPFGSANEYYIGSGTELNPHIKVSYNINITDVNDINIHTKIDGTDWDDFVEFDERNGEVIVYLNDVTKKSEPLLQNSNTGSYKMDITFKYTKNAIVKEEKRSLDFVLIPSDLFINISSDKNILYMSEELLENDKVEGIPSRNLNQGSYVTFYGYVYEGPITQRRESYITTFNVYEFNETWVKNESMSGKVNTLTEQMKDNIGFVTSFTSPGLKKIEFVAKPNKTEEKLDKSFVQYIFVKPYISDIDYDTTYNDLVKYDAYFRTNQENVYRNFPALPLKNNVFELKRNGKPYTLNGYNEWTTQNGDISTIISFGIQYSDVNVDDAKILEIYLKNAASPDFTLYSTHLFSEVTSGDNKIQIPVEKLYNSSDASKYHLVQIVRKLEKYGNSKKYVDYLYIDGVVESSNWTLGEYPFLVSKIVFNNVNISYNLIGVQYITETNEKKFNTDGVIYNYYLAYKDKITNTTSDIRVTDMEKYFLDHMNEITFDGTNVILTEGVAKGIAENVPIPSMMIEHTLKSDETVEGVMKELFRGRESGSVDYGDREMTLWWCNGTSGSTFVNINPGEINGFRGYWLYTLQGTSTMKNRIKNLSLKYFTSYSPADSGIYDRIVVSPNFEDVADTDKRARTFLPEQEWTIKADIADSAHANNTCVGKFVNETTTPFELSRELNEKTKKYIRNTLEGFPILMFFKCGDKVYYFGVYNFNMGRQSYFNLGYNVHTDELYQNCTTQGKFSKVDTFLFTIANCQQDDICVGEVQENSPEFDFHQFDSSILFKGDFNDSKMRMFGDRGDVVCNNYDNAKTTLQSFVHDVALAGTYCFDCLEKNKVSSRDENDQCVNRYTVKNQVPSIYEQMYYDSTGTHWKTIDESASIANLEKLILRTYDGDTNIPRLDYTAGSEYFTVCMGFGLVDSIVKNMNIKSWDGIKCVPAFYDMDCAFGEENKGKEIVVYNAGTDYWVSEINEETRVVKPVKIFYDYWDTELGKGFDYPSSYLFAVIKYAKSILPNAELGHSPQEFWAELRTPEGELRSVDYFMDKYFKSGISMIPGYLASLNYKVKYLYFDNNYVDSTGAVSEVHIANHEAFNGTRIEKVKVWFTKRIQFMDVMMNVMGIKKDIFNEVTGHSSGYAIPVPRVEIMNLVKQNPDVSIAHCAFSTDDANRANSGMNTRVSIYAAPNTPFILNKTESNEIYILPSPLTDSNKISLNWESTMVTRFYGSKSFVDIDKIEAFFTNANKIETDKLEHITYSGLKVLDMTSGLSIKSSSVKTIDLNIPNLSGTLSIDSSKPYGQSIERINIAGSGLYGDFSNLENLNSINISGVNAVNGSGSIRITNCNSLSGSKSVFSGESSTKKTRLATLTIDNAEGHFSFNNTDIQEIDITSKIVDNTYPNPSSFEITNDTKLKKLTLYGFKKVYIKGCNNLETLYIDGSVLEDLYIDSFNTVTMDKSSNLYYISGTTLNGEKDESDIIAENGILKLEHFSDKTFIPKDDDGTYNSYNGKKIDSSLVSGIFNFRGCDKLENLTVTNCNNVKIIKLPNKSVNVGNFANDEYLVYVDTDDVVNPLNGKVGHYPKSKLAITGDSTFLGCPDYAMRTSSLDSYSSIEYTNIEVSSSCTSLANTWNTNNIKRHINDAYNLFDRGAVDKFMKCIKNPENIVSLFGIFSGRNNISFADSPTAYFVDLSEFTSLNDISRMYYGTGINRISSHILSLPEELNDVDHPLNWTDIIKSDTYEITDEALKNISYRISTISNKKYSILTASGNKWVSTIGTSDNKYDIRNFFCPKKDGEGKFIPFTNITSLNNVSFNESQYIDFSNMFELFPNVNELYGFMNLNLSRFNIEGILKPCKNMVSIEESFSNSNNSEVDLWEFFDWENNNGITKLFDGRNGTGDTFSINKYISFENFKHLLAIISGGVYGDKTYIGYKNITYFSNIFRNCRITDYPSVDNEIVLQRTMPNIINISHLFDTCVSDNRDKSLNIRRTFFEKLPNVTMLVGTFKNVHFDHMLDFDFFCKRKSQPTESNVKVDGGVDAILYRYDYKRDIFNMSDCFNGCKFYGNGQAWFSDDVDILENYIEDSNGNRYNRYKDIETGVWYDLHTYEKEDLYNNFSNYIESIIFKSRTSTDTDFVSFTNHPIAKDLALYGNGNGVYEKNKRIFKTYCCLPSDLLYGCSSYVDLSNIFSNSNIIGVIPRHFTNNCQNAIMPNIFKNVNILPNIQFYYNKGEEYLDVISDIPYDNGDDDSVVYMTESGDLRRRTNTSKDMNVGQFVYVPDNFVGGNSIGNVFNFRYNLPDNTTIVGVYKRTNELNNAIKLYKEDSEHNMDPFGGNHHTQYFFTTDKSCKWKTISNAVSPFIKEYDDRDFTTNKIRVYYDENIIDPVQKYMWVSVDSNNLLNGRWNSWNKYTDGVYNSMINLCGKRSETGELEDNGCPVNLEYGVKLSSFISGPLVVFLNGMIFSSAFLIQNVTANNVTGDSIITFSENTHFTKNIILPVFTDDLAYRQLLFIQNDDSVDKFYDFIVDENSQSYYANNEQNPDGTKKGFGLKFISSNKYNM